MGGEGADVLQTYQYVYGVGNTAGDLLSPIVVLCKLLIRYISC